VSSDRPGDRLSTYHEGTQSLACFAPYRLSERSPQYCADQSARLHSDPVDLSHRRLSIVTPVTVFDGDLRAE